MQKVKLKEVCTLINGRAYKQEELLDSGKYPVLRVGNIFSDKDYYYSDLELEEDKYCDKGDLLFAWSASFGPKIWDGGKVIYHYHIWKMVLDDAVDKKYLYYYLYYLSKRIKAEGHGGIMIHTTKTEMEERELHLPDLDDQRKTSNVLNQLSGIIEKRQEEIKLLDRLIKARFDEMFGDPVANDKGWNTRPLLSMGSCKNGLNFHYDDSGVEINCLGVGDFKDYSIIANTASLPTVSLNEMPPSEYLLRDDDIVFVRSNGNKKMVGRSVAVYPGTIPTTYSGFCIRYRREDDSVITPYLLRVLKAESVRQKMYGRGANIQNLNQQTLSSLDIPVPPKSMQEQFAAFVDKIDKSKSVIQKSLDETQVLFDSLMQKYFA